MSVYPVFVPIPFTVNIVTTTKPMHREDMPDNEPIFPVPPHNASELEFKLMRKVEIHAQGWKEKESQKVAFLGGLGSDSGGHSEDAPRVEVFDGVWIPDTGHGKHDEKRHKGSWRQEARFKSTFVLTCPPSFTSKTLSVSVSAADTRAIRHFLTRTATVSP